MRISKVFSSAAFPALLCVWLTTKPVAAKKSRFDAEQEGYGQVTLATGTGEPTSTLFGDCLAFGRMIDAMIDTIAIEDVEYVRYVPDTDQKAAVQATFTIAPGIDGVDSFADCALIAKEQVLPPAGQGAL